MVLAVSSELVSLCHAVFSIYVNSQKAFKQKWTWYDYSLHNSMHMSTDTSTSANSQPGPQIAVRESKIGISQSNVRVVVFVFFIKQINKAGSHNCTH